MNTYSFSKLNNEYVFSQLPETVASHTL